MSNSYLSTKLASRLSTEQMQAKNRIEARQQNLSPRTNSTRQMAKVSIFNCVSMALPFPIAVLHCHKIGLVHVSVFCCCCCPLSPSLPGPKKISMEQDGRILCACGNCTRSNGYFSSAFASASDECLDKSPFGQSVHARKKRPKQTQKNGIGRIEMQLFVCVQSYSICSSSICCVIRVRDERNGKKSAWKPLKSYTSRLFWFFFFFGECEWPGHKMW